MPYQELIALMPCHSLEDFPSELAERPATSLLNAYTVLWHPRLLAQVQSLPRWVRADDELAPKAERLMIVPLECEDVMPPDGMEAAFAAGTTVIHGEHEREKMLSQALAPLGLEPQVDPQLVAEFFAFGTAHLQVELLTRHMRNFSHLDEEVLRREMLLAAQSAVEGNHETARHSLRRCFEMLQDCRERFYPVDSFLIDLSLLTPPQAGPGLASLLEETLPVSILAAAETWRTVVDSDPVWTESVKAALQRRSLELIGGDDVEVGSTLLPLDSTVWHLRRGRAQIQEMFGVTPTVWGRKRFGLGPHLPPILHRLGYAGALHLLLDDGHYPDEEQTLFRWEGNCGESVDAYSRIPLAVDSGSGFLKLPQRLAESMDLDHTAAVLLVRWPELRSPFFRDLRLAHTYAPILGRFVTWTEYFNCGSDPGRRSEFSAGGYLSPELVQAVARRQTNPISRWIQQWERRRKFEQADWSLQMAAAIRSGKAAVDPAVLEAQMEAAHPEAASDIQQAADNAVQSALQTGSEELTRLLTSRSEKGTGVLLVNTLSFPRRVLVDWPSGAPAPHPSVVHVQIDDYGCRALVDLPPSGFLWLANAEGTSSPTTPGKVRMAENLVLRNDQFEVTLSEATGGIARIQTTTHRSPNRMSQQIAWRFPYQKLVTIPNGEEFETFETYYTAMERRESRVLSAGPVIGEIETTGDLIDQQNHQVIGTFRQRTRVVRGLPTVDVTVDLDLPQVPNGDPWTNYVGCRFAWKHEDVAVTASLQQGAHPVKSARIEAPQYIEIADDQHRTTLLTPGLPFHRRTGERMLDTILVTEGETARSFRFAVAVDAKYPLQAQLDTFSPPLVIPTSTRPAGGSQAGWFFMIDTANVQLTRLLPAGPGKLIVRLLETEGRGRTASLRCFRAPTAARQLNFNSESISTLSVEGDQIRVELAPYEICDVELTFA